MAVAFQDLTGERDPEWVERHRAGNEDAFAELYARYHGPLVTFCHRRVGDPHLAEEFAQETFIQAFQALARLEHPYRIYPWLTVIARRLIIDHQRREARRRREIVLDQPVPPSPDELWVAQAEAQEVRAALERIRARHREVLYLRDCEGLSYEEVAERIGRPVTTVPPLLHRARLALRREYLAVTQHDRVAALVPLFAGLLSGPRRLRDRIMQALSQLPDASVLAAPAAGIVFSVAMVLSPGVELAPGLTDQEVAWIPTAQWSAAAGQSESTAAPSDVIDSTATRRAPARAAARPAPAMEGRTVVGGLVQVDHDDESARRSQERARQMPIYIEVEQTGTFVGADPEQTQRDGTSVEWWRGQAERTTGG